jgi:hypothetical protein
VGGGGRWGVAFFSLFSFLAVQSGQGGQSGWSKAGLEQELRGARGEGSPIRGRLVRVVCAVSLRPSADRACVRLGHNTRALLRLVRIKRAALDGEKVIGSI